MNGPIPHSGSLLEICKDNLVVNYDADVKISYKI